MPCRTHLVATGVSSLLQVLVSILTLLSLLTSYNGSERRSNLRTVSGERSATTTTSSIAVSTDSVSEGGSAPDYTIGKWIPSSTSASASSSSGKNEYIWLPSALNGKDGGPAMFDPEKFCEVLNGRSVLLIGDSMTQQYYKALGNRLGMSKPHRHAHGFHVGFSGKICTSHNNDSDSKVSRLTYLRVDYLASDSSVEEENDQLIRNKIKMQENWWKWIDQYEVLLLNTGAHALSPPTHKHHLMAVHTKLQQVYNGTVFFRTTPRGHIGCSIEDIPNQVDSFFPEKNDSNNNNISQLYYDQYHYDWIHQNNAVYRDIIPSNQLLDVAPITELRPDGHSNPSQGDCLHYKSVDVFEPWSWLLLNGLQQQERL